MVVSTGETEDYKQYQFLFSLITLGLTSLSIHTSCVAQVKITKTWADPHSGLLWKHGGATWHSEHGPGLGVSQLDLGVISVHTDSPVAVLCLKAQLWRGLPRSVPSPLYIALSSPTCLAWRDTYEAFRPAKVNLRHFTGQDCSTRFVQSCIRQTRYHPPDPPPQSYSKHTWRQNPNTPLPIPKK